MTDELSIQESLYPGLTCWGCGHANPKGFHLRSYVHGDRVVADFAPLPEHDNGTGFLNGGIIATVLDCHSGAVVMSEAARRGWDPTPPALMPFITAGFDVRFLRPTPLGPAVHLLGWATSADESEVLAHCELQYDGKTRATLDATWKRFRPR